MRTPPCPRCGSLETNGTFCNPCRTAINPLVVGVQPVKLVICERCTRAKLHGTWKAIREDNAAAVLLQQGIRYASDAKIGQVEFSSPELERKPGLRKTTEIPVRITGLVGDAEQMYAEEYIVPLNYEVTACPHCRKKGSTYYEGILQLRNPHPRALAFFEQYLNEHAGKGLHLAKRVEQPHGIDFYLSTNRAVGHLARKLHGQFGGELKISAQHFSEDKQSGKILYRTNALVELPEYVKGDVIKRDDAYLFVLGTSGKIKAENLSSGREERFTYRQGESVLLPQQDTRVVRIQPLEVLHPETFAPVTPLRSKYAPAEVDVDALVRVAFDGAKTFLIPS